MSDISTTLASGIFPIGEHLGVHHKFANNMRNIFNVLGIVSIVIIEILRMKHNKNPDTNNKVLKGLDITAILFLCISILFLCYNFFSITKGFTIKSVNKNVLVTYLLFIIISLGYSILLFVQIVLKLVELFQQKHFDKQFRDISIAKLVMIPIMILLSFFVIYMYINTTAFKNKGAPGKIGSLSFYMIGPIALISLFQWILMRIDKQTSS
jgi:uncharacterized BrkB/YihY/UPF0761 family membrane protein